MCCSVGPKGEHSCRLRGGGGGSGGEAQAAKRRGCEDERKKRRRREVSYIIIGVGTTHLSVSHTCHLKFQWRNTDRNAMFPSNAAEFQVVSSHWCLFSELKDAKTATLE